MDGDARPGLLGSTGENVSMEQSPNALLSPILGQALAVAPMTLFPDEGEIFCYEKKNGAIKEAEREFSFLFVVTEVLMKVFIQCRTQPYAL